MTFMKLKAQSTFKATADGSSKFSSTKQAPRTRRGPVRPLGVWVCVLMLFVGLAVGAAPAQKPNILLILADDLGYSDIGCYGSEIKTPNLDAVAKAGLRFTQFYNTARCWPSRAAILTGYYAQQVRRDAMPGLNGGGRGIRPEWAQLLPVMLQSLGYRSYQSGKWHVDGEPLKNGFDHSYVLDDHNRNFNPQNHSEDDQKLPPVKKGSDYFTSVAFADHAVKCLKEHAAKHPERPFFSYLAFTVPHFPLQALPADIARYKDKFLKGWDAARDEKYARMKSMGLVTTPMSALEKEVGPPYAFPEEIKKLGPHEVNRPLPWSELTTEQREFQATKMAIHAAMVDNMDQEIGKVLAQIKAMGQAENTMVLFLSDNGASAEMMIRGDGHDPAAAPGSAETFLCLGPGWSSASNTPFRRHKTWVHEGGIATPLIISWPKGIAARGEVRHNPGHLIDLVPTLLEIAGGKAPQAINGKPVPTPPGKSLVPAFTKDNSVPHEYLWWLHDGNRALRAGDLKIVSAGKDAPWELYNLKTDRAESKNLAAAQPDKVKELGNLWQKQADEFLALALKDPPPENGGNQGKGKKKGKKNADR
jgi:arylsulfatase A-like enzyme